MQYYFISSKSIQPSNASAVTIQHSKDDKNALPLAGGLGGESAPRGIFPPQAYQGRNIIKMRRIRLGGFFLYVPQSGTYHIAKRYIVSFAFGKRYIVRAKGARVTESILPFTREVLTLSKIEKIFACGKFTSRF